MSTLTIATLFPLSTVAAGDEANATALVRRALARGLPARAITVNHPAEMVDADLYLLGGSARSGTAELVTLLRLAQLEARVRSGASQVVAVDAGMDALGRTFRDAEGAIRPGLGLLGTRTEPIGPVSGTVVTRPVADLGLAAMVGWVSFDSATIRDADVPPLVVLERGDGLADLAADAALADDGALTASVLATRLHGPVLALNPELADLVLARLRPAEAASWPALAVPTVERARQARIDEVRAAGERPSRRALLRPRSTRRGRSRA